MKVYEIVGYVRDGALVCPEHADDTSSPVFVEDAQPGDYCDRCFADYAASPAGERGLRAPEWVFLEGCSP